MRIPINYGEVWIGKNCIRIGISLISRIVGALMLVVVGLMIVFIMIAGGGQYLLKTNSAQFWVLSGIISYFGLQSMGAWSDLQIIDKINQNITIKKHWLFIPYKRKTFPFKAIHSISWQEIIKRKVGAKQLDMHFAQVFFRLNDGTSLILAEISLGEPEKTIKMAQKLASILSEKVQCPVVEPIETIIVIG
jgi:hypothetical protein